VFGHLFIEVLSKFELQQKQKIKVRRTIQECNKKQE
jgi:hypothetical protein